MLKKVEIEEVVSNDAPKFVKTELVQANRDGKLFFWEMVKGHSSVHVIVNNVDTKELLLVKQVRVPVLVNNPGTTGEVIETCAGLVDKDADIKQIVHEEILEELGYASPEDNSNIKHIKTLKSSVGTSGQDSHCFYATVREENKVNEGGGLPEEDIEVIRIKHSKVSEWLNDSEVVTDAVTMFLVSWWVMNK